MLTFKQFINENLNLKQKRAVSSWVTPSIFGFSRIIPDDKITSKKAVALSSHVIPKNTDHIIIPGNSPTLDQVKNHLQQHGYSIDDYEKGTASKPQYSQISNILRSTNPELYDEYQTNKDKIKNKVTQHLNNLNYDIHDYGSGTALSAKPRIESIGSILEKTNAPKQLIHDFANDDRKLALEMNDKDIAISRNPYHIAQCSTHENGKEGRGWDSCAAMNDDGTITREAAKKLPDEIREGTHVAYLLSKETRHLPIQQRIDQAISRNLLKPYKSETGHEVLIPENKTFSIGDTEGNTKKNVSFIRRLSQFTDENFPMIHDVKYFKNEKVHDDDKTPIKIKFSQETLNNLSAKLMNNLNTDKWNTMEVDHAKEQGYWTNKHYNAIKDSILRKISNNDISEPELEHAMNNNYLTNAHKNILASKFENKIISGKHMPSDLEKADKFNILNDSHKALLMNDLTNKLKNRMYVAPFFIKHAKKHKYFTDEHRQLLRNTKTV